MPTAAGRTSAFSNGIGEIVHTCVYTIADQKHGVDASFPAEALPEPRAGMHSR
jgi:hypothetical protein